MSRLQRSPAHILHIAAIGTGTPGERLDYRDQGLSSLLALRTGPGGRQTAGVAAILSARDCQRAIAFGHAQALVTEPPLNRKGDLAFVGQPIAAGMAQHVGMDGKAEAGGLTPLSTTCRKPSRDIGPVRDD